MLTRNKQINKKLYLYNSQFSESYDLPRVDKPSKILIIASTPRCGSHMLGHALHKTNCFGFPLEYVNTRNFAEWKKRFHKESLEEVIKEIQQRRTSQNGVFGIKVHYSHIKQFGNFRMLKRIFPDAYYVFLTRKDVLKQAVSLSIARQSGVWIAGQTPAKATLTYNFNTIDRCLRETIHNNAAWHYNLTVNGCNFIAMDFDSVRTDLVGSIQCIANFMGIDVALGDIPKEQITESQSKEINTAWEKQFLADYEDETTYFKLMSKIKKFIDRKI